MGIEYIASIAGRVDRWCNCATSRRQLCFDSYRAPEVIGRNSNDARSNAGRSRGDNNHHNMQADKDRDRIRNHRTDSHSRIRKRAL